MGVLQTPRETLGRTIAKAIQAGAGGGWGEAPTSHGPAVCRGSVGMAFLTICWWGCGESKTPVRCSPGRNVKWCNCCGKK